MGRPFFVIEVDLKVNYPNNLFVTWVNTKEAF